jgi:hypothetical protein
MQMRANVAIAKRCIVPATFRSWPARGAWFIIVALVFPLQTIGSKAIATELVLKENTRLEAVTASGVVAIIAGRNLSRRYEWNGCGLDADMRARGTRWFGSLGIYDPAPQFLGGIFSRSCNGISRTVVQEAQIHFSNNASAEAWISRYSRVFPTTWTNDGLLVRWGMTPGRNQLSVDLWQICIAGVPPTSLKGATDDAFRLVPTEGTDGARHSCTRVDPSIEAQTQENWERHWRQADEWQARSRSN